MMCTNMTTILSHQEDLGPSMLDVKYEGLGSTGLVTTPLNMEPNLSECNVSHGGIALKILKKHKFNGNNIKLHKYLCCAND